MSTPLRVLIVENEEDDTLLTLEVLSRAGYQVTHESVETAQSLHLALHQGEWDIVISDYIMPRLNGLEALRLVKEHNPGLPFIIFTGTVGEELREVVLNAGAQGFLTKAQLSQLGVTVQQSLQALPKLPVKLAGEKVAISSSVRGKVFFGWLWHTLLALRTWTVVILGILVSVVIFSLFYKERSERITDEFVAYANERAQAIKLNLEEELIFLDFLERFYAYSQEAQSGNMSAFAEQIIYLVEDTASMQSYIKAVVIIPRLSDVDRFFFEAQARVALVGNYYIKEFDERGNLTQASERDEYYPLFVAYPKASPIQGLDLASVNMYYEALENTRDEGEITASEITGLPETVTGGQKGFWLFAPVYTPGLSISSSQERRANLQGFVGMAIQVTPFIEKSLEHLAPAGIDFYLYDTNASVDEEPIHIHLSRTRRGRQVNEQPNMLGGLKWENIIQVGERNWKMVAYPAPAFFQARQAYGAWLILFGGLLVTGILGLFVNSLTSHANRIEKIATERTTALDALHELHTRLAEQMSELQTRTQEISLLSEMGNFLQTSLTPSEAYTVIIRYVQQIFPDQVGALYVLNASRDLVEVAGTWGKLEGNNDPFKPEECWGFRRGQLHRATGMDGNPVCEHVLRRNQPFQEYMCVPMQAQGEVVGILYLHTNLPILGEKILPPFSVAQTQLANTVAEQLGLALANLNLREALRQQAIRDPLTGLFNRRYLEESLDREIFRAKRNNTPLGIIMADIDHFKSFNDAYGHEAGDAVLQAIGKLLQEQVRREDIASRFGGEEFTLVLPGAGREAAYQRAEAIRLAAQAMRARSSDQTLGPITLCLGVAIFPEHGGSADTVMHAADMALYRAKSTGKNRVEVAVI